MTVFWHGGSRWHDRPEVRAPRKGRYECGPGIYLTTSYLRARKYAAGGKVTTLVTLADSVRWLEQAKLPLQQLVDFLRTAPRLRNRHQLIEDFLLRQVARQLAMADLCPVEHLVNLLINAEALTGKVGLYLAEWLSINGIDAARHKPQSQEQWVIVFNPAIIRKYQVVPAAGVSLDKYDLPGIQLSK